jgi:dihydroneopterin aldolase
MTLMLASVTGPEEAAVVLDGGADVIDLKDPAQGAFGAVAPEALRATVAAVAGRRKVSAVAGNLPLDPGAVVPAVATLHEAGAEWVKIGLFPDGDLPATLRALAPLARQVRLVGVLFADLDPDFATLAALAEAGFAGAMLDTARKDGGRLLTHCDLPVLARFVALCRAHGLFCGLAGALEAPDVPRLLVLEPGLLGFRGALCAAGRAGPVTPERVRLIRALIPPERAAGQGSGTDWRVLARGYTPEPQGDGSVTDRVFVRELVLPVSIGVYAHEYGKPQRVRFDVSVQVARPLRDGRVPPSRDLRDIYSYDIISDGIRMLVAAGHIDLVETLAERIAALLLADPRVMQARVEVTKLETGSGRVGVAIERTRATLPAIPVPTGAA